MRIIPGKFGQDVLSRLTTEDGHPTITIAHHDQMALVSYQSAGRIGENWFIQSE